VGGVAAFVHIDCTLPRTMPASKGYAYVTPFQGLGMWDATQTQGVALGWYVMPLRGERPDEPGHLQFCERTT